MNYEKIVHSIIDSLVEHPDNLFIRVTGEDEKDIHITIASDNEDTARLIGKKGSVANAIREVLSIAGKSQEKHIHIRFESFEDESEED